MLCCLVPSLSSSGQSLSSCSLVPRSERSDISCTVAGWRNTGFRTRVPGLDPAASHQDGLIVEQGNQSFLSPEKGRISRSDSTRLGVSPATGRFSATQRRTGTSVLWSTWATWAGHGRDNEDDPSHDLLVSCIGGEREARKRKLLGGFVIEGVL
jgi:hypothetical protein